MNEVILIGIGVLVGWFFGSFFILGCIYYIAKKRNLLNKLFDWNG